MLQNSFFYSDFCIERIKWPATSERSRWMSRWRLFEAWARELGGGRPEPPRTFPVFLRCDQGCSTATPTCRKPHCRRWSAWPDAMPRRSTSRPSGIYNKSRLGFFSPTVRIVFFNSNHYPSIVIKLTPTYITISDHIKFHKVKLFINCK